MAEELMAEELMGEEAIAEHERPADMTLAEALEALRVEGIDTLYTSRLVTPDLAIEGLPAPGPAKARLRALLAPHGLAARPTSEGRWAVVPAKTSTVEGCLTSDPGGQPVAGARLSIEAVDGAVVSNPAGCFRLFEVPPGERHLRVSRPGYVARRVPLSLTPGAAHRRSLELRVDVDAQDEIFVTTTPEDPPLGAWHLTSTDESGASADGVDASDPDLLASLSRIPGSLEEVGVAFGIRGRASERLTLVVDGMDIVEPYHFRHLGSLAGTVTPKVVADVLLHRGSPPLIYGNRAGGVVEMVTTASNERFSGRFGATAEGAQAAANGSLLGGRGRWLAGLRHGRPEIPTEIAEIDSRPTYGDGLGKLSFALSRRQDLRFQALWARDDFSFFPPDNHLLAADDPSPELFARQRSLHAGIWHSISLGSRHLLETVLTEADVERRRFGYETGQPTLQPIRPATYVLDDPRLSRRQVRRLEGASSSHDRLDWLWGAESSRERTSYNYSGFELGPLPRSNFRLEERQLAFFGQATWRPRTDLTVLAGLRWDDNELADIGRLAPRLALAFGRGASVWRASWSRVMSVSSTHELSLGDGERDLPGAEITDYSALGYQRTWERSRLAVELYHQGIADPRRRFVNLYKPISRIPELEIDRLRLAPEASRIDGIELRFEARGRRWQGGATYNASRAEDRLEGSWRPRRTDRRHTLDTWLSLHLPGRLRADLRFAAASGGPTTPFDPVLFDFDDGISRRFLDSLEGYNSARLPSEHRLDLRLSRQWRAPAKGASGMRGWGLRVEVGIDNLYDHLHVRGFDLSPLQEEPPITLPTTLEPELSLGRRLRWGLELSF